MGKIDLDKYYTPQILASSCIQLVYQEIGVDVITDIIEPSAGAGSFSLQLGEKCTGYDIAPEHPSILQQDFLKLDLPYKKGRLIIGNPPFGARGNLAIQFFKKAIQLGDYIAFILPISQYNNTQKMYEFDLVCSTDLGLRKYSDRELHCCFNLYRRPVGGIHQSPPNYELEDLEVVEYRRGGNYPVPAKYDFGMCTWGNGSTGKKVAYVGQFAQEHYVIVKNSEVRDKVLKVCKETDWKNLYPSVSSKKLQSWKILKHLKEQIPELK